MKILFIGDIIGRGGRMAVTRILPKLKQELAIDFAIANVENAAAGFGMTAKIYKQLADQGQVDFMTSGNHIWDKKEFVAKFNSFENLVRPANYCGENVPGVGWKIVDVKGKRICISNFLGRVFLNSEVASPFQIADNMLKDVSSQSDIILVDFHAEVTSEKNAFANYLDGKVSLVVGTHTHVQTADERVLPRGTGYITDLGMVGAKDSIIGMQKEGIIQKFIDGMPKRFQPQESGEMVFNALLVEFTDDNRLKSIERINKQVYLAEE